jgi:hypothetical protein
MSFAAGSSNRSRPDMIAPAGLMKSWQSFEASLAASSAGATGPPEGAGSKAVPVSVIGKRIV